MNVIVLLLQYLVVTMNSEITFISTNIKVIQNSVKSQYLESCATFFFFYENDIHKQRLTQKIKTYNHQLPKVPEGNWEKSK